MQERLNAAAVAELLRVGLDDVAYLRRTANLPYLQERSRISYKRDDILRWRNQRLVRDRKVICNLREYYETTRMANYIDYQSFRALIERRVWVDGDEVVKYLSKQKPWREILAVVGDVVAAWHNARLPRCPKCGGHLFGLVTNGTCYNCRLDEQRRARRAARRRAAHGARPHP